MASLRLRTVEWARNLTNLRDISFSSIGEIPSMEPLKNCAKLEYLDFTENCNVLDGRIRFLQELPRLCRIGYMNRPHYDIKCQEMRDIIEPRREPGYKLGSRWKVKDVVEYDLELKKQ